MTAPPPDPCPLTPAPCPPATADYGGRAPLRRCAACGHLWREAGDCPACGGDDTFPGEIAPERPSGLGPIAPAGRLSGDDLSSPLPSLGGSSLDLAAGVPPSASAAPVGTDPLAGFSLNNPVVFATRRMIALGFAPADFDWPRVVAEARACEGPQPRVFVFSRPARTEAA